MNENEFKAMTGAVSKRLEEKGVFKRLEDEMASLATRIPNLEKKTRLIIKRTGIYGVCDSDHGSVSFYVRLLLHRSFQSGEALQFDEIMTNDGSGFNECSGEFVVPVSGKYLLTVTVRAQYHKQVSSELLCNENMLARVTSGYGGIDKAGSSITVSVEARRSDVICVKQSAGRSGDYHGNGYTTFAGFLFD